MSYTRAFLSSCVRSISEEISILILEDFTLLFRLWPEHDLPLGHQTLEQKAQEGLTSRLEIRELKLREEACCARTPDC